MGTEPGPPARDQVLLQLAWRRVAWLCGRLAGGVIARSDLQCRPHGAFNLAAVAALSAELDIDPAEIRSPVLVLRTSAGAGINRAHRPIAWSACTDPGRPHPHT
jgi:hypothetical protein